MIIYKNDVDGFRDAVDSNRIVPDIVKEYTEKYGRKVNDNERKSWNNSLKFMETALRKSDVPGDCGVLIEYNIPSTSKRIDFIVSGHDEEGNANFVIVELKQWEKADATKKEDLVTAYVGGGVREVSHPSYQAYSYKRFLADMNEAVYTKNIQPYSCAYLHNYISKHPEPLTLPQYSEIIMDSPVFFSQDINRLEAFIKKYVGKGKGKDILYQIENGKIRPSKKFVEYISEMFDGNEVYTLLDEQKVALSNIMEYALDSKQKTTIIVNGGPGTGKSVVAMNALVQLLKHGLNPKFIAPNASFKETIISMLSGSRKYSKKRIAALFSGSGSFWNALDDEFDAMIVDEAHRLKKKGTYMYKGISQVDDVIKASRVNVFFIDDHQRIRPDDEGTVDRIREVAEARDSEVIYVELEAQFRCSGADGFMNWIDHTLGIRETGNFDGWDEGTFEFELVDNPHDLVNKIREKNSIGFKSRILAGYAWEWTSAKDGNPNSEIEDVTIEEHCFSMPWNSRSSQYTWASDDDKQDQIGCIHTSQGLEFDYVGIIIGNDLRFNPMTNEIYGSYLDYKDTTGKKGLKEDPSELTRLIKNIYRVLLSRGMKGCYVYCRDSYLRDYLESRIKRESKSQSYPIGIE